MLATGVVWEHLYDIGNLYNVRALTCNTGKCVDMRALTYYWYLGQFETIHIPLLTATLWEPSYNAANCYRLVSLTRYWQLVPWIQWFNGFIYWPLIGHRPVQAYFKYDTISPAWRTHDTGCFTFCSITLYLGNIRKPIHSIHQNRHYTQILNAMRDSMAL